MFLSQKNGSENFDKALVLTMHLRPDCSTYTKVFD
jgi:hypothetical protein